MSSAVNKLTEALTVTGSLPFSATSSVVLIVLLIGLLVHKEFLRATQSPRAKTWAQVLNIAITPLLFSVGFIIMVRLAILTIRTSG